jgi:hypothetical protein
MMSKYLYGTGVFSYVFNGKKVDKVVMKVTVFGLG